MNVPRASRLANAVAAGGSFGAAFGAMKAHARRKWSRAFCTDNPNWPMDLDGDIVQHIFQFCSVVDLQLASMACKQWAAAVDDVRLWRPFIENDRVMSKLPGALQASDPRRIVVQWTKRKSPAVRPLRVDLNDVSLFVVLEFPNHERLELILPFQNRLMDEQWTSGCPVWNVPEMKTFAEYMPDPGNDMEVWDDCVKAVALWRASTQQSVFFWSEDEDHSGFEVCDEGIVCKMELELVDFMSGNAHLAISPLVENSFPLCPPTLTIAVGLEPSETDGMNETDESRLYFAVGLVHDQQSCEEELGDDRLSELLGALRWE